MDFLIDFVLTTNINNITENMNSFICLFYFYVYALHGIIETKNDGLEWALAKEVTNQNVGNIVF